MPLIPPVEPQSVMYDVLPQMFLERLIDCACQIEAPLGPRSAPSGNARAERPPVGFAQTVQAQACKRSWSSGA